MMRPHSSGGHLLNSLRGVVTAALLLSPVWLGQAVAQAPADPHLLSAGLGYFDINKQDDDAVDLRLEFRPGYQLLDFNRPWIGLKPFAGIEVTTDGAVYGLAGFLLDIAAGERLVVTPSIAVGAYSDGDGKDLGHTVEFRSQLEVGYRFDDESRLSAAFSHISNASLGDDNPGVEILSVYYHLPLRRLFGN